MKVKTQKVSYLPSRVFATLIVQEALRIILLYFITNLSFMTHPNVSISSVVLKWNNDFDTAGSHCFAALVSTHFMSLWLVSL